MANKYNKGRADAVEGKKTLPTDPNAWQVFKSDKQIANERESNATYREGHADKTREMNQGRRNKQNSKLRRLANHAIYGLLAAGPD